MLHPLAARLPEVLGEVDDITEVTRLSLVGILCRLQLMWLPLFKPVDS